MKMSLELLQGIEQAEGKAEEIRAEAQREARDMLKSAEEASVQNERNAALDQRAIIQRILDDARQTAQKRIDAMRQAEKEARGAVTETAEKKLDMAANLIFERVFQDGHR